MSEKDGFVTIHPSLTGRDVLDKVARDFERRAGTDRRSAGVPAFEDIDRQALAAKLVDEVDLHTGEAYRAAGVALEFFRHRMSGAG